MSLKLPDELTPAQRTRIDNNVQQAVQNVREALCTGEGTHEYCGDTCAVQYGNAKRSVVGWWSWLEFIDAVKDEV